MATVAVGTTKVDWSTIRQERPSSLRRNIRWMEDVEAILYNGHSGDLNTTIEDRYYEWQENGMDGYEGAIVARPVFSNFGIGAGVAFDSAYSKRWRQWRESVKKWDKTYGDSTREWWESNRLNRKEAFISLLDEKRYDSCYDDVRRSLEENGFLRPLTVEPHQTAPLGFEFGDGHHRLAAAIDLGIERIPLQSGGRLIAQDSGGWFFGMPIPRTNADHGEDAFDL